MARPRKKKRTKPGPGTAAAVQSTGTSRGGRTPRSMVIRIGAGEVGPSVSQLVKDVRTMMEPETASKLRERKSNRLRDYTTMAGPLGVTHLLLFSRSASGNTNLRIALTPRGPTLHFKVERYSLCKDVRRALKRPRSGEQEHKTPPLLVMNNFVTSSAEEGAKANGESTTTTATTNKSGAAAPGKAPAHLESLTTTVFQSLFPSISPTSTPLTSIRRVLLLNRETAPAPSDPSAAGASNDPNSNGAGPDAIGTYTINLRHYAISTRTSGLSRGVRKLDRVATSGSSATARKRLPDLGKLQDVSEFLLDPHNASGGFTSGSESEAETDGEVEVAVPRTTRVLNRRRWEAMQRRRQQQPGGGGVGAGTGANGTAVGAGSGGGAAGDAIEEDENNEDLDLDDDDDGETKGKAAGAATEADAAQGARSARTEARVEKRAIHLSELGPRLRLRLLKVEEGVCEGRTLWHEYVAKTAAETRALEQRWAQRAALKAERRAAQKAAVERKRAEKAEREGKAPNGEAKSRTGEGTRGDGEEGEGEDGDEDEDEDDWSDEFDDDDLFDDQAGAILPKNDPGGEDDGEGEEDVDMENS